jgi:hypothetical protein
MFRNYRVVNPGSSPGVRPDWLADHRGLAPLKRIRRFALFIATLLATFLTLAACMAAMTELANVKLFIGQNAQGPLGSGGDFR